VSFAAQYDANGKKSHDGVVKLFPKFDAGAVPAIEDFAPNQSRFGLWHTARHELKE
jgi:hypothetical protein